MPVLTIFGGPNGSGKSTVIKSTGFEALENLLQADAIALRFTESDPVAAAIKAGREVLSRTREYIDSGRDFAIETTLSGTWISRAVVNAKARGFLVRLFYICVDTPEINIQRVRERVTRGGHDVPEADIRRRYDRSFSNAKKLVRVVDEALFYDNSGSESMFVLKVRQGRIVAEAPEMPRWIHGLLADLEAAQRPSK